MASAQRDLYQSLLEEAGLEAPVVEAMLQLRSESSNFPLAMSSPDFTARSLQRPSAEGIRLVGYTSSNYVRFNYHPHPQMDQTNALIVKRLDLVRAVVRKFASHAVGLQYELQTRGFTHPVEAHPIAHVDIGEMMVILDRMMSSSSQ